MDSKSENRLSCGLVASDLKMQECIPLETSALQNLKDGRAFMALESAGRGTPQLHKPAPRVKDSWVAQLDTEVLPRQGDSKRGKLKMPLETDTHLMFPLLGEGQRPAMRSVQSSSNRRSCRFCGLLSRQAVVWTLEFSSATLNTLC